MGCIVDEVERSEMRRVHEVKERPRQPKRRAHLYVARNRDVERMVPAPAHIVARSRADVMWPAGKKVVAVPRGWDCLDRDSHEDCTRPSVFPEVFRLTPRLAKDSVLSGAVEAEEDMRVDRV
jgi:hypothetical protein